MIEVLVAGLSALGIAAVIGALYATDAKLKRKIRRQPRTEIGRVSEHTPTKIVGTLTIDGEPLWAPISSRACAYYVVTVEEEHGFGTKKTWTQLVRDEDWRDFSVTDATGTARVRVAGLPRMLVAVDVTTGSGFLREPTDAVRAFLDAQGVAVEGTVFNRTLRIREACLAVGKEVVVVGRALREVDSEASSAAGYREPPTRLVFADSEQARLIVSDDPKLR